MASKTFARRSTLSRLERMLSLGLPLIKTATDWDDESRFFKIYFLAPCLRQGDRPGPRMSNMVNVFSPTEGGVVDALVDFMEEELEAFYGGCEFPEEDSAALYRWACAVSMAETCRFLSGEGVSCDRQMDFLKPADFRIPSAAWRVERWPWIRMDPERALYDARDFVRLTADDYEATAVEKASHGWMTGRGDSLKKAMKNLADMTEARIKSFQALMKGVREVKA